MFNIRHSTVNDELYHYTNAKSFKSIISNKCLRLFLVRADEKSEMYLTRKEFIEIMQNTLHLLGPLEPEVRGSLEKFCRESKEDVHDYFREKTFYASFSTEYDSKHHWGCRYGDYGRGLAIAFNRNEFHKLFHYDSNANYQPGFNELISEISLNYHCDNIPEDFARWIKNYKKFRPTYSINFNLMYHTFIIVLKNKEYKLEKEVRIFLEDDEVRKAIRTYCWCERQRLPESLITVRSVLKKTRILKKIDESERKYREFHMDSQWNSKLIPYVIRGPLCVLSHDDVRTILDESGLKDTKIIDSRAEITLI